MPKGKEKNPVHESITRVEVKAGDRIIDVRVWREEEPFSLGSPKELKELAHKVSGLLAQDTTRDEAVKCVAECFAAMDRVSAVEVKPRGTQVGIVYYPDWQ